MSQKESLEGASFEDVLLSVGVNQDTLEETALAITEWFKSDTTENTSKSAKQKVSIGTALHDIFSKAGFTDTCLYVADFNIQEAFRLYHEEDFRIVLGAYRLKTRLKMADAYTTHQAMGLVFGGGESGGSSGNVEVIDATQLTGTITG